MKQNKFKTKMMKQSLMLALVLGLAALGGCYAEEYDDTNAMVDDSQGRFLFFNTSSTATSLTLLGALILLGVIFYLVYVGGLLAPLSSGYNRNSYNYDQYEQGYDHSQYASYR
jgi:hypothetical protein